MISGRLSEAETTLGRIAGDEFGVDTLVVIPEMGLRDHIGAHVGGII